MKTIKFAVICTTVFTSVGSMGLPHAIYHGPHALPPINLSNHQTTNISNSNTNTNSNSNTNTNSNSNSNSNTNTNNNNSSATSGTNNTITITGPNGEISGPTSNFVPMYNPTPWGNNPVANPCPPGYYPAYYSWSNYICAFGKN